MTPGYQTTEFWVTILTTIGSIAVAIIQVLQGEHGGVEGAGALIAAGSAAGMYSLSRAKIKVGSTP